MFGIGIAHGKFGELLQGALPDDNSHFLVTLPIFRFSMASFYYSNQNKNVEIYPAHKVKAAALANKITRYFGLFGGWKLTINSQLEEGKGLGSSTADLVACARAIENAIGENIPMEVLLNILKEIEPSDGIMYEGIVCFYHRQVSLYKHLGHLSNLTVVGVDEGGIIDTIKFNEELRPYQLEEKIEYSLLLNELINAVKSSDLNTVGRISTKSAILYQSINPKKNLDYFIDISNTIGGLGIIVAHSGTYIGIILDKTRQDYSAQLSFVESKMIEKSLKVEKFSTIVKKSENLLSNKLSLSVNSV